MKILLTGGTGFLGKEVLNRLLEDSQIQEVFVITRKKRTHENPKVRVISFDLAGTERLPSDISLKGVSAVIHLAGLYDFKSTYQECYEQNIIATIKLLALLRDRGMTQVPIHFASTYAVGCWVARILEETKLKALPTADYPYAHSKAVAERILEDSGNSLRIFRLGILMGHSSTGQIEKLDGVYEYMNFLDKLGRGFLHLGISRKSPTLLPVPANPETILPLVPVDLAAQVFARSIHEPMQQKNEYFGVFNSDTAKVSEIVESIRNRILPGARVIYVPRGIPSRLLKMQERLTGVSTMTFKYANHSTLLESRNFNSRFNDLKVPPFSSLREKLLQGYRQFINFNSVES